MTGDERDWAKARLAEFATTPLTMRALEGFACCVCGGEGEPMVPCGWSELGQIFRHSHCEFPPTGRTRHRMTLRDASNTASWSEPTLSDIIGQRLAHEGEHIEDMGHRVAEQLALAPHDYYHYAGEKLNSALRSIVYALAMIGQPEESILAVARDVHERGSRYAQQLARELEDSRS